MRLDHLTTGLLLATIVFGTSSALWAEVPEAGTATRTYGTASESIYAVSAVAFNGQFGYFDSIGGTERFAKFCTTFSCTLVAGVSLPAGAVVTRIELDACMQGAATAKAELIRSQRLSQAPVSTTLANETLASVATSEFDFVPPACTDFPRTLVSPVTINYRDHYYVLKVELSSNDAFLLGVRLYYRLQVSPAPAIATFNDVPSTHPFFPFIQALVAAGITTGCDDSPPLFCPDGLVTRKQMAAFLARALGLHWVP